MWDIIRRKLSSIQSKIYTFLFSRSVVMNDYFLLRDQEGRRRHWFFFTSSQFIELDSDKHARCQLLNTHEKKSYQSNSYSITYSLSVHGQTQRRVWKHVQIYKRSINRNKNLCCGLLLQTQRVKETVWQSSSSIPDINLIMDHLRHIA